MRKNLQFILKISLISIVLIFSLLGLCSANSGVLISVKGKVEIISDGKKTMAKSGRTLVSGDLIKSIGGTAVLVLASGKTQSIKPSQEYKISKGVDGKKNGLGTRLASALNEAKNKGNTPFVRGMVRAEKDFKLLYPSNSTVLPNRLNFDWVGRENTAEAKIEIKSEDSDFNFSFSPDLDAGQITWPENAPKLSTEKRYYWKVTGMNLESMKESSSGLRWFRVLSASESDELEKGIQSIFLIKGVEPSDQMLLKAALLYSFQLDHEVLDILQTAGESGELSESGKELLMAVKKRMEGV